MVSGRESRSMMTMRNDAITDQLTKAIEEAALLNKEAVAVLEKAQLAAMDDMELVDDFRFTCIRQMLKVSFRLHSIEMRYRLALHRKSKAARAGYSN
jgi:hypothetical protein